MIRRFLGALQFLTILPVPGTTASPGEAAVFFPLTGGLLGAAAGVILVAFTPALGRSLGSLLAITALAAITGCLHEDGLADVADAVRAGRTRERMLEILKDSRIGTYGAIALIFSVGFRWQSLGQITVCPVPGLAAALALSRTSLVALAATSKAFGPGMGRDFVAACSRSVLAGVVLQCAVIIALLSLFIGWLPAVAMSLSTALIILLARAYFAKRLNGVNGDCLGATCQTVETMNLLILAWHSSF